MINLLKGILGGPKPAGPQTPIRQFGVGDTPLTKDAVTTGHQGWVVETNEKRTVRLFEVANPEAEQCLLAYRASLKCEGLSGRAYLEMWCRLPGRGEFFSKGINQTITGTTDWASYEIPFFLKKGQKPDLIKLNLVVEGKGKVSIKDIQLLKTPLA